MPNDLVRVRKSEHHALPAADDKVRSSDGTPSITELLAQRVGRYLLRQADGEIVTLLMGRGLAADAVLYCCAAASAPMLDLAADAVLRMAKVSVSLSNSFCFRVNLTRRGIVGKHIIGRARAGSVRVRRLPGASRCPGQDM